MDDRRKKGLCYNCDEKWGPGHKCKNVKLFLLEGIDIVQGLQFGVHIAEVDEEVDNDLHRVDSDLTNLELNPYPNTQLDLFCSDSSPF